MTKADEVIVTSFHKGVFDIDEDGRIWRMLAATRTGRLREVSRCRADGMRADGYRRVRFGAYSMPAHRLVWVASNGAIPDGLEINHKNGLRGDNRLDNLELVTPGENLQHAYTQLGRWRAQGEHNGRAKLSAEEVGSIRAALANGTAKRVLARQYGVTPLIIRKIARGELWSSRDEYPDTKVSDHAPE